MRTRKTVDKLRKAATRIVRSLLAFGDLMDGCVSSEVKEDVLPSNSLENDIGKYQRIVDILGNLQIVGSPADWLNRSSSARGSKGLPSRPHRIRKLLPPKSIRSSGYGAVVLILCLAA